MWSDFKAFIARGNVVDLAVGIIIGTAFTGVVNSLVKDVIMPPVGVIVGGVDFSEIAIVLQPAVGETPAVTIGIGLFINAIINFLIVAMVVFFLVRGVNRILEARQEAIQVAEAKTPEPPVQTPTDTELMLQELKAIRVALEENGSSPE